MLNDWVTETKVTLVPVEHLDQLGEVHERAAEPVDLVDDHDVDPARLDVGEQPLQRRPLQRPAGEAAVVVAVGDQEPALGLLARDIGLAGLPLGIEGVELHVEPLLAALARVDGAAALEDDRAACEGFAHPLPRWFLRPKKTQPFQRVPVMARATEERLL